VAWLVWLSIEIIKTMTGITEGVVIAFIAWVCKKIYDACQEISKDEMFKICFIDHPPPGERELNKYDFYPIPLVRQDHWVKVITSKGLRLSGFNVRFVTAKTRLSDPPTDMRGIVEVLQVFLTPGVLIEAKVSTMSADGYGGIDIVLEKPVAWGKQKAIFLQVDVNAQQNWSGEISFQALDDEHAPRIARTDVLTRNHAPQS
jgi:hypothetical protein